MDAQGGYDQRRFFSTVPSSLVCSICHQVVREPRLCVNGEHCFCLTCISQHLNASQTCPMCREDLTRETLVHPQGCLKRVLRELQIKCDYNERGCSGPIQLGNLDEHLSNCGFASVTCEKCGVQINRKDKDNHEKSFCQLRATKCEECGHIKAKQDQMEQELCQMKEKQAEIKNNQEEMKQSLDDIKQKQDVVLKQLDEVMNDRDGYLKSTNESLNELKRSYDQMEGNVGGIQKAQTKIDAAVNQMTDNDDGMKQAQAAIQADLQEVKDLLWKQVNGGNINNNGAKATDVAVSEDEQAIIIVGGRCGEKNEKVLSTVEKYNLVTGESTYLPRMSNPKTQFASCVHNDDVIVTGGYDGHDGIDTVEVMKINQHALKWTMLNAKLPVKLSRHAVVIYQHKLYVIGGFNHSENKISNAIYELSLVSPDTPKLLAEMRLPRRNHGAEIVNDKLFIFGGRTTGLNKDATERVVAYDFNTNTFEKSPPLLKAICKMSTVTRKNTIIIIGGKDVDGNTLKDVIQYDTLTGKSKPLPSLIHGRRGCSAVILGDVIVVLGGCDEQECLSSVESLKIGDDCWKELPEIKEQRNYATAVVLPRTRNANDPMNTHTTTR